jgi:hypothetical protein
VVLHRLVLVSRHACAGDWNYPGGNAKPGRPLHLSAGNRARNRSCLGGCRADHALALPKASSGGRGGGHQRGASGLHLVTTWLLA